MTFACRLELAEIFPDLRRHEFPALLQVVVERRHVPVEQPFWNAVRPEVRPHFLYVVDPAVLRFPAGALGREFREIRLGSLVADGNVDLRLGEDEVRDLVVLTLAEPLALEVVPGVEVVDVANNARKSRLA